MKENKNHPCEMSNTTTSAIANAIKYIKKPTPIPRDLETTNKNSSRKSAPTTRTDRSNNELRPTPPRKRSDTLARNTRDTAIKDAANGKR